MAGHSLLFTAGGVLLLIFGLVAGGRYAEMGIWCLWAGIISLVGGALLYYFSDKLRARRKRERHRRKQMYDGI